VLKRLGDDLIASEAAFYIMIKADDPVERTDESFVLDLLEKTGVLVVHGSGFGADPQQSLFRLVYLADQEVLGTVFKKISNFLDGLGVSQR
jgi:alanine-synthesizing transaminase